MPTFNPYGSEQSFNLVRPPASFKSSAAQPGAGLPFSFVYGGQSSAELIGAWKSTVREETLNSTTTLRILIFTDLESGLEVRAEAMCYADTGGIDWTLYFTNRGMNDTPILEQVQVVDVTVTPQTETDPCLFRLHGSTSAGQDWLPIEDILIPGTPIEFGPIGEQANSSSGACPFFNLQWAGGGVITAIGWSAPWRAKVERDRSNALRLRAGMHYMHLKLHPGETIRSPRILQHYWCGNDPAVAYNQFRQILFAHIMPRLHDQVVAPPIAHTSVVFWEENACTEADVLSHLESIRGLDFEVFWLDAYWIREGYAKGTGHYGFPIQRVEPRDRFPRGLAPIGEAVHQQGLKFLVWFSPETVWADGDLGREHPEWTTFWAKNKPLADWGQFDLGLPAAREFMTRYLRTVIEEYGIEWLRIDSGMIQAFARERDQKEPDRVGMTEIRYMEGLYQMWDDLRATFPHLAIDNCFGGGRRIDLETSARSLPLWRTDATYDLVKAGKHEEVAILNQMMTAGLSRYVPFSLCAQTGVTPYFFRSGFNGGITFSDDCRVPGYPKGLLKAAIAEGKRIRKYYFGDFYPLTPVTANAGDWHVAQYHLPSEEAGMVLAFRRHESRTIEMNLALRGISPAATYAVTMAHGYEPSLSVQMTGRDLELLKTEISERPGSVLIEYRRIEINRP